MIFIVLFIFCGIAAATFNRKIEQTIPMGVGIIMLSAYLSAITNHLSRAVLLSSFLLVLSALACVCVGCLKRQKVFKAAMRSYLSAGLWMFLILTAVIVISTSHHFVTNWDDFNYWANFPKNIYYKDAMLSGGSLATAYKDYLPIVQLLYYIVFKSVGYFSENLMFATNNILLLIYLVPFVFATNGDNETLDISKGLRNIFSQYQLPCVLSGLLFVPAFSFQSFHCLGVDIIISVMFGYGLVRLFFEKRDLFFYVDMTVYLSVLIMIKSASLMIAVVIIVCLLMSESKNFKKLLLDVSIVIPALVFLGSWKIFCRVKGNVSYLTEKMDSSITGGSFLEFPEYTKEVVLKFFKEIALYPLNDGKFGLSSLVCIIFAVVVLTIFVKKNRRIVVGLAIGMIFYIVFLLYTYLFVFVEWEALSLSSFDRYISLYILGPVYLACYIFARFLFRNSDTQTMRNLVVYALPLIMLLTLNYPFLINTMLGSNYERYYQDVLEGRADVAKELEGHSADLYGKRLLIVNTKGNDELEKYQQYEALPAVTYILRLDYSGSAEDKAIINEELADHMLDYALIYETGEVLARE